MPRRAPRPLAFLLFALPLPLASCLGPEVVFTAGFSAAQAGVSEFSKGRLRTAWNAPIDVMLNAVRDALDTLGFEAEVLSTTGDEWHVSTEQLDGTDIEIYLTTITPRVTLISIRVGLLGDQPLAKLIADRIDAQVKAWEEAGSPTPVVVPEAEPQGTPTPANAP